MFSSFILKVSSNATDIFSGRYNSIKLIFTNGDKLIMSKRDAKYKKDKIEDYIENNIITEAYRIYPGGKEVRIKIR